jgi:Carboxypeptidase regulatory-like domain
MPRFMSVIAVLLVVVATPPIHARQTGFARLAPAAASATSAAAPAIKAATERLAASTMIHGNALDSTNGQLANAMVRLRDARFGRIVETQYTDQSGMFTFKGLEPGSYVVEIVANDQSILAASQLLSINAGEAVAAVVKLPFHVPPFAELMGTTTTQSAAALVLEAAASGITALVPTAPISPNR